MLGYAERHQKVFMLRDDQHLFMGVAWIIKKETYTLELCPEVIFADGTMNTNKDKYPFIVTRANQVGLYVHGNACIFP